MNERNQKEEFQPRNSQYVQIQAGVFIGMVLFALGMRLVGLDESGRFARHLLTMMPIFVLMPVIFNLTSWPVHRNNRIVIDEETITGPVQIGRRLESRTFSLQEIDQQRTEAASLYAKLFGPMKIYATNGETIALDVIGLGRSQIKRIYELLGCESPYFPLDSLFEKIRQYVQENKKVLLNMMLVAIAGTWLFMVFVEGLDIMQSPLLAYFIGLACGVGAYYCFSQLRRWE